MAVKKRAKRQYYVEERRKGNKLWRRMGGSTGTRAEAGRYLRGVKRHYSDTFDFRIRSEYI